MKRYAIGFSMAAVLSLTGCGTEGVDNSVPKSDYDPNVYTGQLIDAPVMGLRFDGGAGLHGVTGENGEFTYRIGDWVSFYIGENLYVGGYKTSGADEIAYPKDLAGYGNRVLVMRLLQSLDEDGDPDNGITIPAELIVGLNRTLEPNTGLFSTGDPLEISPLLSLYADRNGDGEIDVTEAEAIAHYDASMARIGEYSAARNRDNIGRASALYADREGISETGMMQLNSYAERVIVYRAAADIWLWMAYANTNAGVYSRLRELYEKPMDQRLTAAYVAATGQQPALLGESAQEARDELNVEGYTGILASYSIEEKNFYLGCYILNKRLELVSNEGNTTGYQGVLISAFNQYVTSVTNNELKVLNQYGEAEIGTTCDQAPSF